MKPSLILWLGGARPYLRRVQQRGDIPLTPLAPAGCRPVSADAQLRARVLFHFQFIFISSSSNLRVNAPSYSLGFEVTFIGSRYFASTFDRLNFDRLNKEKL